jgi:hypothetical protein
MSENIKDYLIFDFTPDLDYHKHKTIKFNPGICHYRDDLYLCCYRIIGRNKEIEGDTYNISSVNNLQELQNNLNHPWTSYGGIPPWTSAYDGTAFVLLQITKSNCKVYKNINKIRNTFRENDIDYFKGYQSYLHGDTTSINDSRIIKAGKNTFILYYNTWGDGKAKIEYSFMKLDSRTLELIVYPRGYLCGVNFQSFEKNWSMWFFAGELYMTYSLVFTKPKQLQTDMELGASTFVIRRINNSELSSECISKSSTSFKSITPDKIPFLKNLKIKLFDDKDASLFNIVYLSPTTPCIHYDKIVKNGVDYLRYIGVGHLKFNIRSLYQIKETSPNTWFGKFIYQHLEVPKGRNPPRKLNEHYGGYIYLWFFYYFDLSISNSSDKEQTIDNTINQIKYKYGKIVHPGNSTFVQTFPVGLEKVGGSFNNYDFKDDDKYIISYGDYDSLCKLLILSKNEIKKLLKPHDLNEDVWIIDDIHNNTRDFD